MSWSGLSIAHDHNAREFITAPGIELLFEFVAFFVVGGGFGGGDLGFEVLDVLEVIGGWQFEEGSCDADAGGEELGCP